MTCGCSSGCCAEPMPVACATGTSRIWRCWSGPWCPWRESDPRPPPYQGGALPLSHMGKTKRIWSGIRGSNSRPIPWQGIALPTELIPHRPPLGGRQSFDFLQAPPKGRACLPRTRLDNGIAGNLGGLGRNRTTDTRIFKTTHAASGTPSNPKKCNAFLDRCPLTRPTHRTRRRTPPTPPDGWP